jgi:hypothetical protein
MRESVAWQKKYDSSVVASLSLSLVKGLISLRMPQISIVLPLPGSPLIQSSRLCSLSHY